MRGAHRPPAGGLLLSRAQPSSSPGPRWLGWGRHPGAAVTECQMGRLTHEEVLGAGVGRGASAIRQGPLPVPRSACPCGGRGGGLRACLSCGYQSHSGVATPRPRLPTTWGYDSTCDFGEQRHSYHSPQPQYGEHSANLSVTIIQKKHLHGNIQDTVCTDVPDNPPQPSRRVK